jgi:hypothetical protein
MCFEYLCTTQVFKTSRYLIIAKVNDILWDIMICYIELDTKIVIDTTTRYNDESYKEKKNVNAV